LARPSLDIGFGTRRPGGTESQERNRTGSIQPRSIRYSPGRGSYFFIGALSREKIGVKPEPEHLYVSFNQARDRFAHALEQKGEFRITAFISLENAILNDQQCGTGDHDGVAVVLTAMK